MRSFAQLIDQVIGGVIRSVSVSNDIDLSTAGLRTLTDANSDVEEGAGLQFITDNGHYTGFRIPTLRETYLSPEGELDLTDPDIVDIVGAVLGSFDLDPDTGVLSDVFVDARDEDIEAIVWAREKFLSTRGSRK